MKELTKEQLEQKLKEHKQKVQLILVNDLLDKMENLANKTMKDDYEPSYEKHKRYYKLKDTQIQY